MPCPNPGSADLSIALASASNGTESAAQPTVLESYCSTNKSKLLGCSRGSAPAGAVFGPRGPVRLKLVAVLLAVVDVASRLIFSLRASGNSLEFDVPVLRYSWAPLLPYSSAPLLLCSSAPLPIGAAVPGT